MEEEGTVLTSFHEASYTLKLKRVRRYRTALVNADTNIFSKILAHQVQRYIKKII